MRRALLLLLALASTSAAAADRRYSVTDFDRIVVEGPYIVRLTAARASTAAASGSQAALDRTQIDVSGRTLRIRRIRSSWGGNPGGQEGPLTVTLTTRQLRSARVIGPGSLDIDGAEGQRIDLILEGSGRIRARAIAADNLTLGLAGSGLLEVAGTAEVLTAQLEGTGNLAGAALRADNVTITTNTTGTIAVEAARSASVTALGLGEVEVLGRPACTVRGPGADLVRCGAGPRSPLDQR
jgi:hypothetical protein